MKLNLGVLKKQLARHSSIPPGYFKVIFFPSAWLANPFINIYRWYLNIDVFESIYGKSSTGSSWRGIPAYPDWSDCTVDRFSSFSWATKRNFMAISLQKQVEITGTDSLSSRINQYIPPSPNMGVGGWRPWAKFVLWPWNFVNIFVWVNNVIS